jgi:ribonuclease R
VQVSRVDLDARKIDLRLVNEPGIKTVLKNEARRADNEQARSAKPGAKAAPPKKTGGVTTAARTTSPSKVSKAKKAKTAIVPEKARAPKAFTKSSKRKR